MTKEQEAQQAQTIAEILAMNYYEKSPVGRLLKIVDSRAQKIAEQQSEINGYKSALAIEQTDAEKLRQKIAEQAKALSMKEKEIKILKEMRFLPL